MERVDIVHPFPIQAMALPIALQGTDMIGQARTGTGKTLAFGVAVLQRILLAGEEGHDRLGSATAPQALVMTPTRELAHQVARDLETASTVRKARVLTVYGGVSYDPQLEALKNGVEVVVGTPGRLLDLCQRKALNLSHLRIAVLDEADEMLDLGFLPDVERLLSHTPASRQTLLFSATMPSAIVSLARSHLTQPVNIRAEAHDAATTVPDTTQFVYQAHDLDKPEVVARILQADDCTKTMIFCRTKRSAQRLADELEDRGFRSAAIHGDLPQSAREKALKRFRDDAINVLVATDVAARGIDVTGVSHVINHECPEDDKAYVHRIGRTGRAGAKGVAVTLVDWADLVRWKTINAALELGFDDPVETYSTSEHLRTDLGIPEGVKGALPGAQPKDRGDSRGGEGRGRGGRGRREDDKREDERPARKRTRQRRRLRNGKPVDTSETAADLPADKPAADNAQNKPASEPQGSETAGRKRRRRRRRRSSSESQPAASE